MLHLTPCNNVFALTSSWVLTEFFQVRYLLDKGTYRTCRLVSKQTWVLSLQVLQKCSKAISPDMTPKSYLNVRLPFIYNKRKEIFNDDFLIKI